MPLLMLISDKLPVKKFVGIQLYNTRGCVVCQLLRASNANLDIKKGKVRETEWPPFILTRLDLVGNWKSVCESQFH